MSLPLLTPSRCVLLIGDEALYIYDVTFRAARLVDAVSWQTTDFENIVIGLIRRECGSKPVLILNDMTDQHFKGGQRLPKVGVMDKMNVLERKLMVAFPNYPIRGALAIKEARGARRGESEKNKKLSAGLYLYAAVPMSEPVAKTIDVVKNSPVPIAGFFLLPVESADMVKTLAAKLAGKDKKRSRWVIFIGQHHNGALRQVIIRDGQLAMTRMTPAADADADHEAWAREVSQEFKATISYLSRFGFTPDDGVDVIVICGAEAGQEFERLIDIPCHYTALSAPEAARELGMNIGVQEDLRYADPLHAAWVGRKTRFILPMKAPELEKVHRPRQVATFAILLLLMGGAYLGWVLSGQLQTMMATKEDIRLQRDLLAQAESDYQKEIARMESVGFDVKLVQGAIKIYEKMEDHRLDTLPFISKLDRALGEDLRLDAFTIDYKDPVTPVAAYGGAPEQTEARPTVRTVLKLSFPSTIDPAAGVREVNSLQRRLQNEFPDYEVFIEKNVAGLEYSDSFSGATGQSAQKIATEEYAAELVIQGDLK